MADFILGRLKFTFQGEWTSTTAYIKDDIVEYNGTGWVCKANHTSTASFPEDRDDGNWEAITTGFNFRNQWNIATTYELNDVVQWEGSTWISVQDSNVGHEPTSGSGTYWDLFVQGDADSILTTKGDIIYRDTTASTRLPIGSDNAILQVNTSGVPIWSTTINGADDVKLTGQLYGGTGAPAAETALGLTDIQALFKSDTNAFAQFAIHNDNNGDSASTDFIAYADNGDNDSGWIDMGITSSGFTAAAFGLTEANDGYLFFSSPAGAPTAKGNLVIATDGNGVDNDIIFATGGFATGKEKMRLTDQDHDGFNKGLNLMDDVSTTGGAFYVGPDAKSLTVDGAGYAGLTHVTGLFVDDVDDFVQFAIKNNNTGTSASTDLIAYSSDGDNDSGWIDLGITSENYSDPEFTVTGPNTGYLFMSAPDQDGLVTTISGGTLSSSATTITVTDTTGFPTSGTLVIAGGEQVTYSGKTGTTFTGCTRGANSSTAAQAINGTRVYKLSSASYTGDLIIGTGIGGSHNDIVIFSGGFDAGNERIRVIGNTRSGHAAGVEILAATESTSTTTGALRVSGGVGLIGNMNIGGNINIAGTITVSGGGSSVSTTTLTVSDPMIVMGSGNTSTDTVDLGFYGIYGSSGTKYTGLVRDATDGVYKLFTDISSAPTTTVNFTSATYAGLKTGAIESTGAVTSIGVTTTGTLAVNASGGVTTNQSTFPLVNTNATTVNFAGAATTISVGASTGTTTFNSTTASSSSTTGAVKVAGGLGVAGAMYGGGVLNITGATTLQSTVDISGKTTITGTTKLQQILEKITVSATSATGTINFDALTQGVLYYTSNAGGNFTINVRGDGSNTLNSIMATGESLTIAFMNTNGGTAYYHTGFQVDGASVTPKWQGGSAPSSGNTSSIDIYTYTIIKTASATYTVLASQTKFA